MKNLVNGFKGFLDLTQLKWSSELNDKAEELIQSEAQRTKRKENTENSVRDKWDLVNMFSINVIGVPEGEESWNGRATFNE